jgi:ribonucleoside-diphosphate reductase alpha chain
MSPTKFTSPFRTLFSKEIAANKYFHEGCESWSALSETLVRQICGDILHKDEIDTLIKYHTDMKFIAGGRYLYYAGRPNSFFNNCYIFKSQEDTREDWAQTSWKHESSLMTGGGCGNDYSVYRPKGSSLRSTGGVASGAVSKMRMINEIGREVMQGAGRRSALYASLNWQHGDAPELLVAKNWFDMRVGDTTMGALKIEDPNFPCPLDMTNVSFNYDNEWLKQTLDGAYEDWADMGYAEGWFSNQDRRKLYEVRDLPIMYLRNVEQAMSTGEPGMSFNFFDRENETGRNACTEVTSGDDNDVCNLGSVNMSRIETIEEFRDVVRAGAAFLILGGQKARLPYDAIRLIRDQNNRIGLGLMGIHEWLMKRGYRYEMVPELRRWLEVYKDESERAANEICDKLGLARPKGYRAIAPTGTIGLVAGTTTGIEPLFATAYIRTYITNGTTWESKYVIDGTARQLIEEYGLAPENIETAMTLAKDPERRIKFQADVQDYVDMGISSTINLPEWGSEYNNESRVVEFAHVLAQYAHRLRGFTCYPDGARGNQPLKLVDYNEAVHKEGKVVKEEFHDICDLSGKGGTCGA